MIFDLVRDFADVLDAMPAEHPRQRILKLLNEAIRRDAHFVHHHRDDYPQGLFQCLWNTGWWYDCPNAAKHYVEPDAGWKERPAWERPGEKLSRLLERWRMQKAEAGAGVWLRSERPPWLHLGTAQQAVLRGQGGQENLVNSVAFSPDSRRIASASGDKTIRLWDVASGAELAVLRGHENSVNCVAFSPDGRWLASGACDKTVRLWDAASGAELAVLRVHENSVNSVAFSPDGRRIASASGNEFGRADNTVRLWDSMNGAELAVLRGHIGKVGSVSFSPDGRRIASASHDHTLRLWDAESGAELAILNGHRSPVLCVRFSPDGRRIASGSGDNTVRLWDSASGKSVQELVKQNELDKAVWQWDPTSEAELAVIRGHELYVNCVEFSPDGVHLASASGDHTVRLWDAESGAELAILRGHENSVESVAFSPDGRQVASGSSDTTVRLWDTASVAGLAVLCGHENRVQSVAFSPDGRRIASGSGSGVGRADNTVRLWDAESGVELAVLRGCDWPVHSVAFSADGRRIAGQSEDTTRVWDAETFECLEVNQWQSPLRGATNPGGAEVFAFRAVNRGEETIIESTRTGQTVAIFPAALYEIITRPPGRTWAGGAANHLYLLTLEGDAECG